MRALAGKRAVVAGADGAYATELAGVLAAGGADVAVRDEPGELEADIVVVCPPKALFRREVSVAEALPVVAAAERWMAAAAGMQAGGVIVHVAGLSGLGGWPGWEASGAVFAAIRSLVQSHAVSLAPHGVRVNMIAAGIGEEQARIIADHKGTTLDQVRARIPAGAFMNAENLGNALLYLVHDSSSYVTGETLVVDGGWDIWGRLHAAAPK